MNADSLEKETASARSHTEQTVTNEAQTPEVQVVLFPALIGVHRRPSAVGEGLGEARKRRRDACAAFQNALSLRPCVRSKWSG
jgi:hypothetical protein